MWDRRALGRGAKPAGVLVGHSEGLTHLDSKGDGRYLLSNSKDQTARLWDVRKVRASFVHESTASAVQVIECRTKWRHGERQSRWNGRVRLSEANGMACM